MTRKRRFMRTTGWKRVRSGQRGWTLEEKWFIGTAALKGDQWLTGEDYLEKTGLWGQRF